MADTDIVVIQNGKFIIGEAKSDASEFSTKVIKGLIWVGNNLLPDKIIVSCNTGSLDETVIKIKNGLTAKSCEVISYVASSPRYYFPGIFGLPKEDKGEL